MKSLNSQDQWTWKFALKFFLALLLNNVLFISENFLQNAIANAQPKPQPTIPYPYKLLPNQPSSDCAIGDDTDFHYHDEGQRIVAEILQWNPVERQAWLKICEGKPFDTGDYLKYLKSEVSDWINNYNDWISDKNLTKKKKDTKCVEFNLDSDQNLKNIKSSEISKILDKKPVMKKIQQCLAELENKENNNNFKGDLFEFYNQLKIVIWIGNFVDRYNNLKNNNVLKGNKCVLDSELNTIFKLRQPLDCLQAYIDKKALENKETEKELKHWLDKVAKSYIEHQEIKKRLNYLLDSLKKSEEKLENLEKELKDLLKNLTISKNFLRTILLREPFRSALPNKVTIRNAIFAEEIDLSSTNINVELHLEDSVFEKKVNFTGARFSKSLYFDDSTFEDVVLINNAFIEGDLFLRRVTLQPNSNLLQQKKNINLLNLSGIKVNGKVDIKNQKLQIHDQFILANITPLNLRTAQIGVSIEMQGSCWLLSEPNFDYCNSIDKFENKNVDSISFDLGKFNSFDYQDSKFFNSDYKNPPINTPQFNVDNFLPLTSCWLKHKPNFDCFNLIEEFDYKKFAHKDVNLISFELNNLDYQNYKLINSNYKSICRPMIGICQVGIVKELVLPAVKVGDALIMDSETEFSGLNLSNSQIPYFIINIPEKKYRKIDKIDTLIDYLSSPNPIVNFFRKSQPNNNKTILNKLTRVKISFEDARISNFQVNPTSNEFELEFFPHIEDEDKKICNFDLDGFVYEDINFVGFNILNFCLHNKYQQVLNNKNDDGTASQLLQPLDQLAIISRDLGLYQVEDELLYRRKKLELVIAEESRLFWEWLQLNIGDLLYGFGYKRLKILRLFLIFLILGIYFAYMALIEKQKTILKQTIELRKNETKDELREKDQRRYKHIVFERIKPHLDFVDRIIFHGHINSDSNEQEEKIYLGFKPELDANELVKKKILGDSDNQETDKIEFVKIILIDKDNKNKKKIIKYIIQNVDERNKNNRKVGICQNLLPNSGWHLIYSVGKNTNNLYYIYSLDNEKGEYCSCIDINLKYISILTLALLSIISAEILIILLAVIFSIIIIALVNIRTVEKKIIFKKIKKLCLSFTRISRKSWIKSFIYSLDSIIPLIELDQELKDFIVEDSEGLPKGYFIFQQILGTIIASILLPILFITGL